MLALFILISLTVTCYLLLTSSVSPEDLNEMLRAEDWY